MTQIRLSSFLISAICSSHVPTLQTDKQW